MNGLTRKAALWLAGALVLTGGLAFGSPSIPLLSDDTSVAEASPSPDPSISPEPTESPEASEAPEPSESPKSGDNDAKKARSTEGCPEGFTGNHGQYVSGTTDRPRNEAAHSECGKPVKSSDGTVSPKPSNDHDKDGDHENNSGSKKSGKNESSKGLAR